jgi:hypothetical protein
LAKLEDWDTGLFNLSLIELQGGDNFIALAAQVFKKVLVAFAP